MWLVYYKPVGYENCCSCTSDITKGADASGGLAWGQVGQPTQGLHTKRASTNDIVTAVVKYAATAKCQYASATLDRYCACVMVSWVIVQDAFDAHAAGNTLHSLTQGAAFTISQYIVFCSAWRWWRRVHWDACYLRSIAHYGMDGFHSGGIAIVSEMKQTHHNSGTVAQWLELLSQF